MKNKKVYLLTVLLLGAGLLVKSKSNNLKPMEPDLREIPGEQETPGNLRSSEGYVVGTFSEMNPAINIHSDSLEKVFVAFLEESAWFVNARFDSATIIDYDVNNGDTAYLALWGKADSTDGHTLDFVLGVELAKDHVTSNYVVSGGHSWSCTGKNFSSCEPKRSTLKVVGCDCVFPENSDESYCNHSSSGDGILGHVVPRLAPILIQTLWGPE